MGLDVHAPQGMGGSGPISPQALSDLVGAIYDCVLVPSRWPDALAAIRKELNCRTAALSLQELPSGRGLLHVCDGIEPYWLERIPDYGLDALDIWGGAEAYHALPLHVPLVLTQVTTCNVHENRYYREWARPQGLFDVLAIGLTRDVDSISAIGFGRHDSAGAVGARETAIARLLTPHLHRAVLITRLLDARSIAATTFDSVFDIIGTPIVVVGEDLAVLHANRSARDSLEQRMPLFVHRGRLVAAAQGTMAALTAAIRRLGDDESGIGAQGIGVPAVSADGNACVLHILPLKGERLRHGVPVEARAAIFVASRTAPAPASAELVRALFGLTPAEGKVYARIVAGLTVEAAALELGVAPSTVKTHLLRVYEKTGTHRRSELVTLAASLAAPAQS